MPNNLKDRLSDVWGAMIGRPQSASNALDKFIMTFLAGNAVYPSPSNDFYLESYCDTIDVFTVINKITEGASTVPVFQYDKKGNIIENGKMLKLLNKPNNYQSQAEFIEAAMSFYYIFGEGLTAFETLSKESGSLNAGVPMRLDQLPPQWIKIEMGTVFDPVKGYSFYPLGGETKVDYEKQRVFHWKEFNPDYTATGGHLRGMSRLRPLVRSITGSDEGYNSLVKAFQSQGMWGIVTMLDPETNKAVELSKEQKSLLKKGWKNDMRKGELTVSNSMAHYEKMGLTVKELDIVKALTMISGKVTDAFNVPDQLFAGSQSKTYSNYKEAERALWTNARCPSLDAFLAGLTALLAPSFPGEEDTVLKADYSEIEALQFNKSELITWMVAAQCFTRNEIREAVGFELSDEPGMDEILVSAGLTPISEVGMPPDPGLIDSTMKSLKLSDYRKK